MNLNDDPEAGLARPLDNRTLWEQVRDRLREDILAGRLEPGTELSEVALARDFGTSRGPREALGRLASEGLVTITPRRGAVVTQLSRQEFIDAYQVREALETLAVRLAVPLMSDAELAHLREMCELMARAARDDEVRLFFDTNQSFHEALVRGSRNRKLHEVHRVLVGQMAPYLPRSLELRGNLGSPSRSTRRSSPRSTHATPSMPPSCSRSTSRCRSACSSPTPTRRCFARTRLSQVTPTSRRRY